MVGRVGDSSLLGCGTFANENSGCSLTGHGESIIKMGLARSIVDDIATHCQHPRELLKKNLEDMYNSLGHEAGGVVLLTDGSWAAYNLTGSDELMPYAVVKNGQFFCPSEKGEENSMKLIDPEKRKNC